MDKNKSQLELTIERNTQYFLKPKNAALSMLLEPNRNIYQSQLPKLHDRSYQQILLEIQARRRNTAQAMHKLQSQKYLNKLMRSQTIDGPALQKSYNIIQSCEDIMRNPTNMEPQIQFKTSEDDEYKAIRKADKLHTRMKEQIYKSLRENSNNKNKKALHYIKEDTITLDKDKFLQKCNRQKFQLQQFRERPGKEREFKRFRTIYHDLDL